MTPYRLAVAALGLTLSVACTSGPPRATAPTEAARSAVPSAVPSTPVPVPPTRPAFDSPLVEPMTGRQAVSALFASARRGDFDNARRLARGHVDDAALRELARRPDVVAKIRGTTTGIGVRLVADPQLRYWPPCEFFVETESARITAVTSCPAPRPPA